MLCELQVRDTMHVKRTLPTRILSSKNEDTSFPTDWKPEKHQEDHKVAFNMCTRKVQQEKLDFFLAITYDCTQWDTRGIGTSYRH